MIADQSLPLIWSVATKAAIVEIDRIGVDMDKVALRLGILLYPGVQLSAALGLTDLFTIALKLAGAGHNLRIVHLEAEADAPPRAVFDSNPDATTDKDAPCDVLILPPSLQSPISPEAAAPFTSWLRERHAEGSVIASICAGAFLLGETGLLEGRAVTTHWGYAAEFQARYPTAKVDSDRLIIDNGDIISAGGMMAWTDLGLILVSRLLGPVVMAETARTLVIDMPGREQRYYSGFVPRLTHGDAAILKAQHFLQANEGKEANLVVLAAETGLEPRTFLRRFQKATGFTSTDYAQRLRVAKAQELLQFGQLPIENIAWEVGYTDVGAFRKVFMRIVGLTPGDYRQRFHT